MIITNENDGYIFFEVIKRLEAMSILDVGMLLKRIGAVSRCAMNEEVPKDALLAGVDFFPETDFPVWKNVYDQIIQKDAFLECQQIQQYDLAVMLGAEELAERVDMPEIIRKVGCQTCYVLTDALLEDWKKQKPDLRMIDVSVENDRYYLLDFGE